MTPELTWDPATPTAYPTLMLEKPGPAWSFAHKDFNQAEMEVNNYKFIYRQF